MLNTFAFLQSEDIAKKTLHLIDKLGGGLLATKLPGEKPSVFHTDKLTMTLDRQTPDKMAERTLGEGKEKVSLPSAKTLFGSNAANLKSVDAQVQANFNISDVLPFHYASTITCRNFAF